MTFEVEPLRQSEGLILLQPRHPHGLCSMASGLRGGPRSAAKIVRGDCRCTRQVVSAMASTAKLLRSKRSMAAKMVWTHSKRSISVQLQGSKTMEFVRWKRRASRLGE